jgi:hypothetical protein
VPEKPETGRVAGRHVGEPDDRVADVRLELAEREEDALGEQDNERRLLRLRSLSWAMFSSGTSLLRFPSAVDNNCQ